jgi:hypothetical protein
MVSVGAFVLVIAGTLGLLANEFMFDWSSAVTLLFAASNVIGLVGIGIGLFHKPGRKKPDPE